MSSLNYLSKFCEKYKQCLNDMSSFYLLMNELHKYIFYKYLYVSEFTNIQEQEQQTSNYVLWIKASGKKTQNLINLRFHTWLLWFFLHFVIISVNKWCTKNPGMKFWCSTSLHVDRKLILQGLKQKSNPLFSQLGF